MINKGEGWGCLLFAAPTTKHQYLKRIFFNIVGVVPIN